MSGTAALGVLIAMLSTEPMRVGRIDLMPGDVLVKHATSRLRAAQMLAASAPRTDVEINESIGEIDVERGWLTARARIGNADGELIPDGFLVSELTAGAKVSESVALELQVHNSIDEDWREVQLAEVSRLYDGHGMPLTATLTAAYTY